MKSISVQNITKSFNGFIAVDNVSFDVYKGEILGFLGTNGAGKTTVIRMLCGLLSPTAGKGEVAGIDIYNAKEIKKNIGYMSQKFSLYEDLTPRENLEFYGGIYGMRRNIIKKETEDVAKSLNLHEVLDQLVGQLPLGTKQKVSFAVSVFHQPKVLFLDEPTAGTDPISRKQIWEMIYQASQRGITIFVTTHSMDEADYCDRVSIMVSGTLKAIGTPENLKNEFQVASIKDIFYLINNHI
jgi:ABC-2 type transport system ATP-binding protein